MSTSARVLRPLPGGYDQQRTTIQRVATHVLARARFQAVGKFGLALAPGGIATPAFGPDATVVRITLAGLAVDRGGSTTWASLDGASLRDLALAAGADLEADFSAGSDAPDLGDPDETLDVDRIAIDTMIAWLSAAWSGLDSILAGASQAPQATPARIQLWPEHFDAGTNVGVGPGADDRVNLGISLGDGFSPEPYLYGGPWSTDRPGDPAFWNAPFGAVRTYTEIARAAYPGAAARAFFDEVLGRFA